MSLPPVDEKLSKFLNKLGNIPDHEVAQLAGVSRTAVVNFRKRQGISPYEGHRLAEAPAPAPAPPVAAKQPPAPVAKAAPVLAPPPPAAAAVFAAPVHAKAASAGAAIVAFSVAVEVDNTARTYVVAASDIVSAARLAVDLVALRHAGASVKGVQKLGELL